MNMEQLINLIKKNNVEIVDLSTDDGDLEDVFLRLIKNQIIIIINSKFKYMELTKIILNQKLLKSFFVIIFGSLALTLSAKLKIYLS